LNSGAPTEIPPEADRFYAGAVQRIVRVLLALTVVTPFAVWRFYGAACASGFFLGSLISWLNFKSLAYSVEGLADRIVEARSRERGGTIVTRFLLRYVLVGIVAYAIFRGSSQAFRGFLFGLCLPVGAMLCEAAFEAYAAFRRGY
jgi:hypothetical protein